MRTINFIGDLHCQTFFKKFFTPNSVQLGDLCLLGYDEWSFEDGKRYFVCGNHDDFTVLDPDAPGLTMVAKNLFHIPRGHVDGKMMFVGGADSIDRKDRLAGRDWFPEEAISQKQFDRIMSINKKIEVIVSHDCPQFVVEKLLTNKFGVFSCYRFPSNLALEAIFEKFKPKMWIFGHHHRYFDQTIRECRFVGLDIGQSMQLSVPTKIIGEQS